MIPELFKLVKELSVLSRVRIPAAWQQHHTECRRNYQTYTQMPFFFHPESPLFAFLYKLA